MAEPRSELAVNIKEFDDAVPASPRAMPSKVSSPEPPKKPPGFGLWAVCTGGIFVCYFFYGLLQEKMYVKKLCAFIVWSYQFVYSFIHLVNAKVNTNLHINYFCCSTKRDYDGEHFQYFGYLVFIQCIINALFAYAGTWFHHVLLDWNDIINSLCKEWCTSWARSTRDDVGVFVHLCWCHVIQ